MMLLFALAGVLFQWYVGRKAISSVTALSGWPRKRIRITTFAIVLWIALYPLMVAGSYFLGFQGMIRRLQSAGVLFDSLVLYPFWIGVVFAIQASILLLGVDLIRVLLYPAYRKIKTRWLRAEAFIVAAVVLTTAFYTVARVYADTLTVRVREADMRIAGLPPDLDGFRIVHIADLQVDERTNGEKLKAYLQRINQLDPDLILFCGDVVTSGTRYIEEGVQALAALEVRHGLYACLGDHDIFSNRQAVTEALHRHGLTLLDNSSTSVRIGSADLSLTGLTNIYRTRPSESDLDIIERQRSRGSVNILLTHQPSPELVQYASRKEYDLFVAGHTHGGQIVFPLPGFSITGSKVETSYVSGFYRVGGMTVSVNNGLGLTLAPIRYHAPAEVTLIRLRPAS